MRGYGTNIQHLFFFSFPCNSSWTVPLLLSPYNSFLLKTHDHSPMARAMHSAIRQARLNDKFQDSLYLFLELVRAGVMHGHLWSGRAFSGGPSFGTGECQLACSKPLFDDGNVCAADDEKSCMLLVMRTLSIVPLNFKVGFMSAVRKSDCGVPMIEIDAVRAMVCAAITGTPSIQLIYPIAFPCASNASRGDYAQHAFALRCTTSPG